MTFIISIFGKSDDELNMLGEGTLYDAYRSRHESNGGPCWTALANSRFLRDVTAAILVYRTIAKKAMRI